MASELSSDAREILDAYLKTQTRELGWRAVKLAIGVGIANLALLTGFVSWTYSQVTTKAEAAAIEQIEEKSKAVTQKFEVFEKAAINKPAELIEKFGRKDEEFTKSVAAIGQKIDDIKSSTQIAQKLVDDLSYTVDALKKELEGKTKKAQELAGEAVAVAEIAKSEVKSFYEQVTEATGEGDKSIDRLKSIADLLGRSDNLDVLMRVRAELTTLQGKISKGEFDQVKCKKLEVEGDRGTAELDGSSMHGFLRILAPNKTCLLSLSASKSGGLLRVNNASGIPVVIASSDEEGHSGEIKIQNDASQDLVYVGTNTAGMAGIWFFRPPVKSEIAALQISRQGRGILSVSDESGKNFKTISYP